MNEGSSKMLANITKVLKALNEEATIVEIGLPEHISEDTRERLEQVVLHLKAEAIKGTGNYVLCSCVYDIYKPETADNNNKAEILNKNGFLFLKVMDDSDVFDGYFAILATDIGRDVIYHITKSR